MCSDRTGDRRNGESIGPLKSIAVKHADDWPISSRRTKPEHNPLNIELLQRRKAKQGSFIDLNGTARRDSWLQALCRREANAKRLKDKQLRQRRVPAVNLMEASDSDSSSDGQGAS